MYTASFLLGILCLIDVGSHRLPDGSGLMSCRLHVAGCGSGCINTSPISNLSITTQAHNTQLKTRNSLALSSCGLHVAGCRSGCIVISPTGAVQFINPISTLSITDQPHNTQLKTRNTIINIAKSQLHVREVGGNNRGREVQQFLDYVKLPAGAKWCAAYVSWVFGKAGFVTPRTGWSPSLFPLAKRTITPKPADLIGIYYSSLGRISHCGIIETVKGDWIISIEGNTSISGSRDGDGVERKRRHRKTISKFADWTVQKGVDDVH